MDKKGLNLSDEEKVERKRIANIKYYENKGKKLYKSKYISKKGDEMSFNVIGNGSTIKMVIKNGILYKTRIEDFLEQLICEDITQEINIDK